MNILEEIAGKTRERIGQEKGKVSVAELKERIQDREQNPAILPTPSFYQTLKKEGMSYICEVKKASPSKGLIAPDFPYLEIAKEYKSAGASAISCLTEPFYFQGSDQYLWEIASEVDIPVLRKDFRDLVRFAPQRMIIGTGGTPDVDPRCIVILQQLCVSFRKSISLLHISVQRKPP